MKSKLIALAYCIENIEKAEEIEKHLSVASYNLPHIYGKKDASEASISAQIRSQNNPILLLISDNFLKSPQCMNEGLKMLNEKKEDILPVIVDGRSIGDKEGKPIPTKFERVSDIIQYINYWQDQYLDLRRQKRDLKELDEEKFNQHLKVMRAISSEVGEFLRTLRTLPYISYEALVENDFEAFFDFTEDPQGWETYKRLKPKEEVLETVSSAGTSMEEAPVNIESIPGIDLLPSQEEEESIQEELTNSLAEIEEKIQAENTIEERTIEEPFNGLEEPVGFPIDDEIEEEEETQELPEPIDLTNVTEESEEEIEEEVQEEAPEDEEEEDEEEINYDLQTAITSAYELVEAGNAAAAMAFLKTEIEENGEVADLRYHYALLMLRTDNNIVEAKQQLEAAVQVEPDNEDALFLLADLAVANGEPKEAVQYYKEVLALNPIYPNIYSRLGFLYLEHFEDKSKKAAKYFKNALLQDPQNVDANYQYAVLLNEHLGKPKKAARYFEKVLLLNDKHPFAHYDLALHYLQEGESEEARNSYLKAILINPDLETDENDLLFNPISMNGEHEAEEAASNEVMEEEEARSEDALEQMEKEEIEEAEKITKVMLANNMDTPETLDILPQSTEIEEEEEEEEIEVEQAPAEPTTPEPEEEESAEGMAEEEVLGSIANEEEKELHLEAEEPEMKAASGFTQTVLINGATAGLGKALAELFAEKGYHLILSAQQEEALQALRLRIEADYQVSVETLVFDVEQLDELKINISKLQNDSNHIDLLINNVIADKEGQPFKDEIFDRLGEIVDSSLNELVQFTKVVGASMVEKGQGHIITLSDDSKPKVTAFTNAMQEDLMPYDVRVSHLHCSSRVIDGENGNSVEKSTENIAEIIYFMANSSMHIKDIRI